MRADRRRVLGPFFAHVPPNLMSIGNRKDVITLDQQKKTGLLSCWKLGACTARIDQVKGFAAPLLKGREENNEGFYFVFHPGKFFSIETIS